MDKAKNENSTACTFLFLFFVLLASFVDAVWQLASVRAVDHAAVFKCDTAFLQNNYFYFCQHLLCVISATFTFTFGIIYQLSATERKLQ